jgi:hypothetical protein
MSDFSRWTAIGAILPVAVCAHMIIPAGVDAAMGNCLACHLVTGDESPGSIRPPGHPETVCYQSQLPQQSTGLQGLTVRQNNTLSDPVIQYVV